MVLVVGKLFGTRNEAIHAVLWAIFGPVVINM